MITRKFTVDFANRNEFFTDVMFVSGDINGYKLQFQTMSGSEPYILAGHRVVLNMQRPDGESVVAQGTVIGENLAEFIVPDSAYAVEGRLSVEMAVYSSAMKVSSVRLYITVREPFDNSVPINDDRLPVLSGLIIESSRVLEDMNAAVQYVSDLGEQLTDGINQANGHLVDEIIHITQTNRDEWNGKQDESEKAQPNGYAPLDSNGKLPQEHIDYVYPKTEVYNKLEIDGKISGVYRYKGSVPTASALGVGVTVGDVFNVIDTGMNYAWTGAIWDNLGSIVTRVANADHATHAEYASSATRADTANDISGDAGYSQYFGTDDSGNKGYHDLPISLEEKHNIEVEIDNILSSVDVLTKDNVALGNGAMATNKGVAVGAYAEASQGVAVGNGAKASSVANNGIAIGSNAVATRWNEEVRSLSSNNSKKVLRLGWTGTISSGLRQELFLDGSASNNRCKLSGKSCMTFSLLVHAMCDGASFKCSAWEIKGAIIKPYTSNNDVRVQFVGVPEIKLLTTDAVDPLAASVDVEASDRALKIFVTGNGQKIHWTVSGTIIESICV